MLKKEKARVLISGIKEELNKDDYSLPLNANMYDMCVCNCDCKTECARKHPVEQIFTCSDFSEICSKYTK